jgi:chromosome segregation ATPase
MQHIAEETKAKLSEEQTARQKAEAAVNDIASSLGCEGILNSAGLHQDIARLCQTASDEHQGRLAADAALTEAKAALLRYEPENAGAREEELAMLDSKLASLEAMAETAAEALAKADARRAELEARALEFEATLQSQAEERDTLMQGKLAAERRAQAAGQIAAEVQAAMGRLQTRLDAAANGLASATQAVLKLVGEAQSVNDGDGQEAAEAHSTLQPMDALERELTRLQTAANSLPRAASLTNPDQLAELAELVKEVKEQRGLAERALQETSRLTKALTAMERRAVTAEAELTRETSPADTAASRDAAIQAACESISSLEERAAALTKALEAERQQATILIEKERQQSSAALERAEQQAAKDAIAAKDEQQAALRGLQDDLAAMQSERDELQKEKAQMTDAREHLQATCKTHTVALQETQQRLATEVAARADMNAAFDQMKRDLEALRACDIKGDKASIADEHAHHLEDSHKEMVEQLRAQVAHLERTVQRVSADQPNAGSAATADAAAAAAAASLAEREARAAKEAALRAATVAGEAQAVAEARASAAAAEAERARAEQISLASELRGAQAELNDALTRASSAEARVVELTERTGQLRSQLRDIQGEVARWREDASAVGTTRDRALAAEQRLDEAQAALDVLSAERSRLAQELTRARDDAELCRRQEEEANRKLQQANAELVAQTKALDAVRAELHRRDEAAASSKAKETMEGKTEQARIKRLKTELAEVHVLLKEALTGVGQETAAGATVGALCKQTGARLQQLDLNVRMLQRELSEAKATRA